MGPGAEVSPHTILAEGGGCCRGNVGAAMEDVDETLDHTNQLNIGKPPRSLSVMRHCISSARLTGAADWESDIGIISLKSPSSEKSGFLPVLRSGSWSEIGPKQYMEDEYICIDNFHKHLGAAPNIPSPGAFYGMLDPKPESRPKASEVLYHPLFWSSELRLSFLHDASDRVELEDWMSNSHVSKVLEGIAPTALGGKWDEKMEPPFLADIGRYRRYKFDSVRDLLRVIQNKLNHYRELPKEIQEILGPVPEGFDSYFSSRFPRLLIEVYKVVCRHCKEEGCYFRKSWDQFLKDLTAIFQADSQDS